MCVQQTGLRTADCGLIDPVKFQFYPGPGPVCEDPRIFTGRFKCCFNGPGLRGSGSSQDGLNAVLSGPGCEDPDPHRTVVNADEDDDEDADENADGDAGEDAGDAG